MMKILWYVNIVMPKVAQQLKLKKASGGGWLEGQADALSKVENISLTIVNITTAVKELRSTTIDGIEYILLPKKNYINSFIEISSKIKPDLYHIHGTEYSYNTDIICHLSAIGAKFVVSIQGIIHSCAKHYCDGLPTRYEKNNPIVSLMDNLFYADSIATAKNNFIKQGINEIAAFKLTKNVIGRTEWDKDTVTAINNKICYFSVNENLRDCFYCDDLWTYTDCTPYSIFVSQGFYPIKGIHNILYIFPELIKRYPNISLRIGGQKAYTLGNKILDLGVDYFFEYQSFIKKLIRQHNLESYIYFTGSLSAQGMKEEYLKCNIFLSCSTIENSPNSVAEAMILGVPVVASNVGGTSTLLRDDEGLLYTSLDKKQLYDKICFAFDNPNDLSQMSKKAREHAVSTHDRDKNIAAILEAYQRITAED